VGRRWPGRLCNGTPGPYIFGWGVAEAMEVHVCCDPLLSSPGGASGPQATPGPRSPGAWSGGTGRGVGGRTPRAPGKSPGFWGPSEHSASRELKFGRKFVDKRCKYVTRV
jgi:hypothetical protein